MPGPARLYIRDARPDDREAVFRFAEKTWDWGDYVPQVWDAWLSEANGRLLVGTLGRKPVALCHVVMAGPGEGWLEGLRVDPGRRRSGIATSMLRRCLRCALDLGARVGRFITSSLNTPMHELAPRLGFNRGAVFTPYEAEATPGGNVEIIRPGREYLARTSAFLRGSPALDTSSGLYSTGWRFHTFSEDELARRLERGQVRVTGSPERITAMAVVEPGFQGQELAIPFVDGRPDALEALAREIRSEAVGLASGRVIAWIPDNAETAGAFVKAGYVTGDDHPFWVYEIELPG